MKTIKKIKTTKKKPTLEKKKKTTLKPTIKKQSLKKTAPKKTIATKKAIKKPKEKKVVKAVSKPSKSKMVKPIRKTVTTTRKTVSKPLKKTTVSKRPIEPAKHKKALGNVYWANSQKIDASDQKQRRQYAVTKDNGKSVRVAKIRGYNNNPKNNERLMPLDQEKYKLSKKSGVDKKVYTKRADTKKPLSLKDRQVFDKKPAFKLSSHDTHRVISHTRTDKKKGGSKTSTKPSGAGRNNADKHK